MLKKDSSVMRSLDAKDESTSNKREKYDFPDTLEGFDYKFNESKY